MGWPCPSKGGHSHRDTDLGAGGGVNGQTSMSMPQYCSTGGQPGLPGEMDAGDKLPCSAGQSQERPVQAKWAGGPPVVPALFLGVEIMRGVQGKWPTWPGRGAGLGILWAPPGEGHCPPQNAPLFLSLGVLSITIPLSLTSQKQNSGGAVLDHTATAGLHPAQ